MPKRETDLEGLEELEEAVIVISLEDVAHLFDAVQAKLDAVKGAGEVALRYSDASLREKVKFVKKAERLLNIAAEAEEVKRILSTEDPEVARSRLIKFLRRVHRRAEEVENLAEGLKS